jgi:hypothetical protein
MSKEQGKDGAVYSGGTKVGEINTWEATFTGNPVETPVFGDDGQVRTYTLKDCSGSFSGYSDTGDSQQNALVDQFLESGTPAAVVLALYTSGSRGYYGSAVVEVTRSVEVAGIQTFSCSFNQADNFEKLNFS